MRIDGRHRYPPLTLEFEGEEGERGEEDEEEEELTPLERIYVPPPPATAQPESFDQPQYPYRTTQEHCQY
jgi:hypothetical protein